MKTLSNLMCSLESVDRKQAVKTGGVDVQFALINDDSEDVREAIAIYGNNDHRWLLIDDFDPFVRKAVAEHGTEKMRQILSSDPHSMVRRAASASRP
ncbi:HEAT repeat domain-containing protein [Actinomyces vulturis]|uniref:HEAT repeat domain-containing protein n=1 Tax=Actinomyces vulturis TaxID=1857645 RepID=UPI000832BCDF|nr:HEAT repeat domain-containing protein [Actinomyces vulturis]